MPAPVDDTMTTCPVVPYVDGIHRESATKSAKYDDDIQIPDDDVTVTRSNNYNNDRQHSPELFGSSRISFILSNNSFSSFREKSMADSDRNISKLSTFQYFQIFSQSTQFSTPQCYTDHLWPIGLYLQN